MIKFYCDINVMKLAKFLRFAGFDTTTRRELSKSRIEYLCLKDRRIFITRNKSIKNFRAVIEILNFDNINNQLNFLLTKYQYDNNLIGSRCIECNVKMRTLSASHQYLLHSNLTTYRSTHKDDENIKYCPRCGKYFWKGTHFQNMLNKLKENSTTSI